MEEPKFDPKTQNRCIKNPKAHFPVGIFRRPFASVYPARNVRPQFANIVQDSLQYNIRMCVD